MLRVSCCNWLQFPLNTGYRNLTSLSPFFQSWTQFSHFLSKLWATRRSAFLEHQQSVRVTLKGKCLKPAKTWKVRQLVFVRRSQGIASHLLAIPWLLRIISNCEVGVLTAWFTFRRVSSGSTLALGSDAGLQHSIPVSQTTFPIAAITCQHGITSQLASLIKDFLHPLSVWCSKNNFFISPPLLCQANLEVLRRERLHFECSHWLLSKTQGGYQNVVDVLACLQHATVSGSTLRYLLQVIEQNSPPFLHSTMGETSVSLECLLACIDSEKFFVQNLLNKWTRASEGLVSLILEEVCMHFSDPNASIYSLIELSQKSQFFQGRVDTLWLSRNMNHLPLLKFHDLAHLSPGG